MDTAADKRIVALLRDGGSAEEGVRMLVGEYGRRIYWHIRRLVLLHEEAEELTQDTFIKAYRAIDSFQGKGSFGGWLYRIATNEALQHLRAKKVRSLLSGTGALAELDKLPSGEVELSDAAVNSFTQAVIDLPPRQRTVFSLRYYDDMPYEEISRIVGITVSNAKTTYHHAVTKIKRHLTEHSYE